MLLGMKEKPEARIVAELLPDGMTEIMTYEPYRMRLHRTGLKVPADKVDKTIRDLKTQLERAGNHVTVKEM